MFAWDIRKILEIFKHLLIKTLIMTQYSWLLLFLFLNCPYPYKETRSCLSTILHIGRGGT